MRSPWYSFIKCRNLRASSGIRYMDKKFNDTFRPIAGWTGVNGVRHDLYSVISCLTPLVSMVLNRLMFTVSHRPYLRVVQRQERLGLSIDGFIRSLDNGRR